MDTEKRFVAALAAILAAGSILCGCRHPMADYEAGIISGNYSKAADIAVGEIIHKCAYVFGVGRDID